MAQSSCADSMHFALSQVCGLQSSVEHAKAQKLCAKGDCIVALHRIGNASVIKIVGV